MGIADTFAERLLEIRGDMSQEVFAKKLGVSRGSISLYEQGKRLPDIEVLRNIAEKFNVSCDWLVGLTDTKVIEPDIKTACETTGLTQENINMLKTVKEASRVQQLRALHKNHNYSCQITYIDVINTILERINVQSDFIFDVLYAFVCLYKSNLSFEEKINKAYVDEDEFIENYPNAADFIDSHNGFVLFGFRAHDFVIQNLRRSAGTFFENVIYSKSADDLERQKANLFQDKNLVDICNALIDSGDDTNANDHKEE